VARPEARYPWIRVLSVTAAGAGLAAMGSWGGFRLALSGVASAETLDLPASMKGWMSGAVPAVSHAGFVFGATPLPLVHAIENVRGTIAWPQTRSTLKARGECLVSARIVPAPVRDEDNCFATPFWSRFHDTRTTDASGRPGAIVWADTH
jgi:hypothetical protein